MKITHLVIGMGEIGTALADVLQCDGIDKDEDIPKVKIIHICFPYSNQFVKNVQRYTESTSADLVVIHSTIPLGTTRQCGENAVHSPVRGKHPHLAEGIKTFTKFFGGTRAKEAAFYFAELGISAAITEKPENTEAMKLWDTEIYLEAILLSRKIYQYCKKRDLDFDIVYTQANRTYNEGYERLDHPEYVKYVLKYMDGPIGGHCLKSNHNLLYEES